MGDERRLWECGKPDRVFHHFHGRSEGGKGEVTFSLRPRRGRSLAPPFPPFPPAGVPRRSGFSFCYFFFWRCAHGYGSAGRYGAAAGIVSGKE